MCTVLGAVGKPNRGTDAVGMVTLATCDEDDANTNFPFVSLLSLSIRYPFSKVRSKKVMHCCEQKKRAPVFCAAIVPPPPPFKCACNTSTV